MRSADGNIDMLRLRKLWQQLGEVLDTPQQEFDAVEPVSVPKLVVGNTPATKDQTLSLATEIYRFRRKRDDFFRDSLFSDPGWDILLELYRLRLEGRRASVKSVCIASGVPPTTALRWINILISKGLLERTNDLRDHRVRWIALSDEGYGTMREFLLSILEGEEGRQFDLSALKVQGFAR